MLVFFSMIRLPSQVPRPYWLAGYVLIWFLKSWGNIFLTCVMFFVLARPKTAGNHASLEQLLKVIWETGFWAVVLSLAQIKPFSVPMMSCLLRTDLSVGPYLSAVPQRSARLPTMPILCQWFSSGRRCVSCLRLSQTWEMQLSLWRYSYTHFAVNEYLRTLEISPKTPDFWFFGQLEALAHWDLFPRASFARNQLSGVQSLRWGVSVRGREPVSRLSIQVCVDTRVYTCPVTPIACLTVFFTHLFMGSFLQLIHIKCPPCASSREFKHFRHCISFLVLLHHKLPGLSNRGLVSQSSGGQRYWPGPQGVASRPWWQLRQSSLCLRRVTFPPSVCLHMAFSSLCACLCVSFQKDNRHDGLRAPPSFSVQCDFIFIFI